MPTFDRSDRFNRDLARLAPELCDRFKTCIVEQFVPAMAAGAPFPAGLRIKRVQGQRGVWEMTFAPDGRATFEYGDEVVAGEPHVVWRRVGTHDLFKAP